MADITLRALDPSGFPARWHRGDWSTTLGWLHVASDLAIFGAFVAILMGLAHLMYRRRDVPFPGLVGLFVSLILICGVGHAFEAVIFWHPVYRLAGLWKAVTATLSWVTVFALVRVMPRAPELNDSVGLNRSLHRQMEERTEIERAFRRNDADLRMLALVASRTDNAVVITDAEGHIEWVNEGFTRITEYAPEEVLGRRPGTFLQGPDTDPATVAFMRERLRAGEPFRADVLNYSKSGRAYWLSLEVQPLRDESGRPTHFMAIESDVTERRRVEEALRVSEERFALAVSGSNDGLWDWDLATDRVYYSPRFKELLGYGGREDEFQDVLETFRRSLHPEDRDATFAAIRAHLDRGATCDVEYRLRTRSGAYRWFRARGRAVRDEAGRPVRMAGSISDIGARKQAEARLRDSEARLQAILDSSRVIIYQKDTAGRYTLVNRRWSELFGIGADDALGKTDAELFPTEYAEAFRANDRRVLEGGEPLEFEEVAPHSDGPHTYLSIKVPMLGQDGIPYALCGTSTDITDRQRTARALEERTRLAALGADVGMALTGCATLHDQLDHCAGALVRHLDAAFARIWTVDPGGDLLVLRASRGMYTHLDGDHSRVPIGRFKIGMIAERREPHLTNGVQTDTRVSDRGWARREGLVSFAGYPLLVGEQLVGVMAMFAKHTLDEAAFEVMGSIANALALGIKRDQDERAMRDSESRKGAILRMAPDAIITTDDRGRILEFNPAAEATFGYRAQEVVGRDMAELIFPPEQRAAQPRGVRHLAEAGEGSILGRRLVLTAQRRDGARFPAELAVTAIETGGRTLFTGQLRDITERVEHERTLRIAKEQAEEASRAKSQFLANMSHEIRTPLTAVLGFAEVLRRGVDDERERRDYLETIDSSGRHLLTLINDVLDLSKIEAGRMETRLVRCAPHRVMAEVLSILRVRASENGLDMEIRWHGRIPETIETDPDRLRQLLMNLVGNAIKFTERGGVRLEAAVDPDGPEPRLAIEVQDTGIGIDPGRQEHIFSPFAQVDGSTTRRFGGTGLGLAISRYIARSLGGDLTVRSTPGVGSVFRATLATGPLDDVRFLERPPTEVLCDPGVADDGAVRLDGAKVLLVEDGSTNRKLIGLVLRRAGAEVRCVEDGRLGVEAALDGDFDLVLMDMQMPVLDGYGATRQLRAAGFDRPIVALTAHALRGEAELCLEAGCTAHLTKPIDHEALLSAVRDHLGRTVDAPTPEALTPASDAASDGPPLASTLPLDDPEFREIVEEFLDALRERTREMDAALRRGDLDQLAGAAHWLKGAGGTAGFDAFTAPARRLEQAAKLGAPDETRRALDEVRALAASSTTLMGSVS